WSRFFVINGSTPNFSRRIGPYLSNALGNDQIFASFDATARVGLLYRDLFGAALAGMWSVDALIAQIAARRPHFVSQSRLLAAHAWRVERLREWLKSVPAYAGLTADDIETLCNDPPLPFFVLFEAMAQPGSEGMHLGPFGSIIVAEVIFGALAANPRARLAEISQKYYPSDVFEGIPDIHNTPALPQCHAEVDELKQAEPAFL